MSFLHSFGFKNIKVFKNEASFDFAPITVFTGTNSSGKSTVSEALRIIINQFKKFQILNKGEISNSNYLHSLKSDTVDKRTSVLQNILNHETDSNTINFTFPINLRNYRLKCSFNLEYKVLGENVKVGELVSINIKDNENDTPLYVIKRGNNKWYTIQINYKAFYDNYISIIHDIEQLQEDEVIKDSNKTSELIRKLLGSFTDYLFFENSDGRNELSPPYLFSENVEFDFNDINALINKEKLDLNTGLYSHFTSKKIFELIHPNNEIDHDQIFNLLHTLHKEENIEMNDNTSSDYVLLAQLSKYEFEFGMIDGWSPLESLELDQNILSPNGILFNLLKDKYSSFFENIKTEYEGNIKNIDLSQRYYLNRNIKITDQGNFFFNSIIGEDLRQAINSIIEINKQVYNFSNKSINTNDRYFDLRNNDFTTEMFSFYAENLTNKLKNLEPFIDKWINIFQIGDKISFNVIENQCKINIHKNNKIYNLSDEGFGYNRLLPLILTIGYIYSKNKGFDNPWPASPAVLFVEEPETGLHPALQSKLADFFFEAYSLFNIQFVIETHSEYLIRRLQVLTASDEHDLAPEHTQLYYFYHPSDIPNGELQYYPINIDKDGVLSSNFGTGFFDESSNLNIALYLKSKANSN